MTNSQLCKQLGFFFLPYETAGGIVAQFFSCMKNVRTENKHCMFRKTTGEDEPKKVGKTFRKSKVIKVKNNFQIFCIFKLTMSFIVY